jgi:hypothetical protein
MGNTITKPDKGSSELSTGTAYRAVLRVNSEQYDEDSTEISSRMEDLIQAIRNADIQQVGFRFLT